MKKTFPQILPELRAAFPSLSRMDPLSNLPVVYLDGPAGSQVPQVVIDDVDYCVCSAYKFFGPHVGILWGRYERLEQLPAYKLRPSPAHAPGKWMTGTQNFAAIAGVKAAIDYIASIHSRLDPEIAASATRRQSLCAAFESIQQYETALVHQLIQGLLDIPRVRVFGITDPARLQERVPTVVLALEGVGSREVARQLAEQGIFSWHGDYYAVDICRALGQAEHGMLRLGILHTTTPVEIERTLEALRKLSTGQE